MVHWWDKPLFGARVNCNHKMIKLRSHTSSSGWTLDPNVGTRYRYLTIAATAARKIDSIFFNSVCLWGKLTSSFFENTDCVKWNIKFLIQSDSNKFIYIIARCYNRSTKNYNFWNWLPYRNGIMVTILCYADSSNLVLGIKFWIKNNFDFSFIFYFASTFVVLYFILIYLHIRFLSLQFEALYSSFFKYLVLPNIIY